MTNRILVAEDENSLRCMLMTALTMAGYAVSVVDNGLDLLRLASSSSGFDLIITDIEMPKGEGGDMIALLREKGIHTPAIIVTAHRHLPAPSGVPILEKPFNQDVLLRTVAESLDRERENALA